MKRALLLSLLLVATAACSPSRLPSNNSVDIDAAAIRAQSAVDAYGAKDDEPVAIAAPAAGNAAVTQNAARPAEKASAGNALVPLDPPAPGMPGGPAKDGSPLSEASFTPDSAQGATMVVQSYYALIGEGKYREAFALRDPGGAAGPNAAAEFAEQFARYAEYHANVGRPGAVDAGAGQRYVSVPVQIYARLKQSGEPFHEIGSVTLHRTGDVDGATASQRTWHIRSIDLKPVVKR